MSGAVSAGRRNGNGYTNGRRPVTITGGAGFIGINLANRLLEQGQPVRIFDDLSGPGVEDNLEWLRSRHRGNLQYVKGDVRDAVVLRAAINGSSFVFHLAARESDPEVDTLGTLQVLEGIARAKSPPGLLFASTTAVYGSLADVRVRHVASRCAPADETIREYGIDEQRPLELASPRARSKCAAEQSVFDYCHDSGLNAVVLRMSCIYGPHQQAAGADQAWVTHFLRTALAGEELTVCGDGRQVRDLLYVDDLVDALLAGREHAATLSGHAYNIGGGSGNTLSLREMIAIAAKRNGRPMEVRFTERRAGEPSYFAADHRRFTKVTGWHPATSPEDGIDSVWMRLLATGPARRRSLLPPPQERAASPDGDPLSRPAAGYRQS